MNHSVEAHLQGQSFRLFFGFFGNVTCYGTSKAATRLGCCPDASISSLGRISRFALFDVVLLGPNYS